MGVDNTVNDRGTLIVWDVDGPPPAGDWTPILWRGFGEDGASEMVSIPTLIEMDAEILRARYLAWVYELGERRIKGMRLVDQLGARPGFSFWWMTLLAEKCNFSKSPQITDAIRLMALESWAAGRPIKKIVLASANVSLAACMRSWCARSSVSFEWRRGSPIAEKKLPWARRVQQWLPDLAQALIWLIRYLARTWPLRGDGLAKWRAARGQVTFVSYLFNLAPEAAKEGRFESRYWAHLPDDLRRNGCKTNWLHLHINDALLPGGRQSVDLIHQFNETGGDAQVHATLDSFLSIRGIIRTLLDYGRLVWTSKQLQSTLASSRGSGIDLWPLFERDWQKSTVGLAAMSNALFLNLFESAFTALPQQRVGVYLQENQGWELAMIHSWKVAGHARIIGVPHSTVKYWDLRYFFDSRNYSREGLNILPLPDQAALNGAMAIGLYKNGNYPMNHVVEVEALRYLHLVNEKVGTHPQKSLAASTLRILVLGDYLSSNTQQQIRLLEKAVQLMPKTTAITVKPHPACPIKPADYPGLFMQITSAPISELLSVCDVAYTSNATSAAADVYCAGIPVISVLDPNALNQSPLRGRKGAVFASTPEELANALVSAVASPHSMEDRRNFFTLDLSLPRWRKLLSERVG